MDRKLFKNREIVRLQKEIDKIYELEKKSELSVEQYKRISFLSGKIMKLEGQPEFDIKKGWEDLKNYYLPKMEKYLQEMEILLNEIYEETAKKTGMSLEEVKYRMKQPIDVADFVITNEQGQQAIFQRVEKFTYEEILCFFIGGVMHKEF